MTKIVAIAVRGGEAAKTRAGSWLDGPQRSALVLAMLRDMLEAIAVSRAAPPVIICTASAEVGRVAAEYGAEVLADAGGGLNAVFAALRAHGLAHDPRGAMAFLPGDLPLLSGAEVDGLFAALHEKRVVLTPAEADGGTGAVCLPPDVVFPFSFGENSFERHCGAARRLGLDVEIFRARGLMHDIDQPADFAAVLSDKPRGHTAALLREIPILRETFA